MASTLERFKGLILSADELQSLTDWPGALIEDYLNLLDSLSILANETDTKQDTLRKTAAVTSALFAVSDEDELFCATDLSPITVNLPAGVDGRNIRIHNIGTSGNSVTISPNGLDRLLGYNSSEVLYDQETIIITYNISYGWD